jgi:DNA-binding MarR family transcriptional regulator
VSAENLIKGVKMKLSSTFDAVKQFYVLDPVMPLRLCLTFLFIAKKGKEGATMKEIATFLDLPQSATSRQVAALSDHHWNKNKQGLGLVTTEIDPDDWRQKIIKLTSKGQRLAERLEAIE